MNVERWIRVVDHEAEVARLESECARLRSVLERKGYRERCDIPACNCGNQWTHGGHADERLREISDALRNNLDLNGKTLLRGVSELLAERDEARALLLRVLNAAYGEEFDEACDVARAHLAEGQGDGGKEGG